MQIELQLAAGNFLNSTKNFIKSIPICTGQQFQISGQTVYIDKVIVTDAISLSDESYFFNVNTSNGIQAIPGWRPIIRQEVEVKLVTENNLIESGVNEAPAFQSGKIDLLISLTALLDNDGEPFLRIRFESVDYRSLAGLLSEETKETIEDLIRDHFNQEDRPIDTGAIEQLVDDIDISITNVGVAINTNASVLFIRLEANGDGNQLTNWDFFFNHSHTSRISSRQWALIFDKELLEESIRIRVRNQLNDSDKFDLQTSVSVSWSWSSGAKFNVSFSGEVIDACTCFFSEIDVDTDIDTVVTLSVPHNDTLRTHMYTTYDADDGEVFCCALTAGLFWPIVGIIYLADEDNDVNFGHYIAGILFAFWIPMIGAAVAAGDQSTSKYFDDIDENCEKINDEVVQCEQDLNLNFGDIGGVFTATTMQAISQGPVLSGTISTIPAFNWGTFSLLAYPIGWNITGSCTGGGGFQISQFGSFVLQPLGGFVLCSYGAINDPLGVFSNITVEELGAGARNYIVTPVVSPEYENNPYPCLIRIITNVGIRILNLGNLTVLSEEEMSELQMKAIMMEANCPLIIKVFPWQFKKEWLPDPPPDERENVWEEIWQIVVTDLTQAENISVLDERGRVWAEGVATKYGAAQLSVFRENMQVNSPLTIEGNISGKMADTVLRSMNDTGTRRKILLKQMQLLRKNQIALNGKFKSVHLQRINDGYTLEINTDISSELYNFSKYNLSRILKSPSLRQPFIPENYNFMGRDWQLQKHHRHSFSTIEMYDVKRYGNLLLIRDAEEIHIADEVNRNKIVSVTAQPGMLNNAQFVRFYGLKNALYINGMDKTSTVYDYNSGDGLQKLTTYHHRPWFDKSARIDSVFVRLSDDGKHLNIYSIDAIREI